MLALICLSLMIGAAATEIFHGRDTVTPDELKAAIGPMQEQMDDHAKQLGEVRESIMQLEIDTARIAEHLGVSAHPTLPR